jgi:hypothetical protein
VKGDFMPNNRIEKTLKKHTNSVVSTKEKIRLLQEQLQQEEELEQQAKSSALLQLLNDTNLSYEDIKSVVMQIAPPVPIPEKPPTVAVLPEPETTADDVFDSEVQIQFTKENSENDEETD